MSDEVKATVAPAEAPQSDTKECTMCGKPISRVAKRCEHCKSLLLTQQCIVCWEYIPLNADYCNQCKSYQDGRWHLSYFGISQTALALVVAVMALMGSLFKECSDFLNRDSDTKVVFQSATLDEITIIAMNTGLRPSLLRRCFLEPAGHDVIKTADLKIVNEDLKMVSIIPANGQVAIRLRVRTGLTATVPHSTLTAELKGKNMLIVLEVEESTGDKERRSVTVGAEQLDDFIVTQAPEFRKVVPR